MTTAASASGTLYLWLTSGTCRWLLFSQSHHPSPAFSTIIHQSCGRPSFNLSSSSPSPSPSSFSPRLLLSSFSSNRSHNPRLFLHTGGKGATQNYDDGDGNGNGNDNNNGNNNGSNSNGNRNPFNHDDDDGSPFGYPLPAFLVCRGEIIIVQDKKHEQKLFAALLFFLSLLTSSSHSRFLLQALAHASPPPPTTGGLPEDGGDGDVSVWQVKGSKWIKLVSDVSSRSHDGLFPGSGGTGSFQPLTLWEGAARFFSRLMLPDGYPYSVTSDYLEYSLWRGVQGVASQINGVLATQSLLYAVGLGKGAIPTVAAVNWVLKDGIGYLSKIMLSKLGRHFDVHPKGWRLFADLLENAAFGMELLTPAFPQLFVIMGAIAASSRSAASLIQASTRSCFYAGFAAQRNFAEVIAKGEAQGMVSKSIGIMLGITLANHIGSSTTLAVGSFFVVSGIHMFCNWKSYLSIQLRTLNPYRASLVFSEYLLTGQIPPIEEVNSEEPLFPCWPVTIAKRRSIVQSGLLSPEAKNAAIQIEHRLLLGSKLSDVINRKEDVSALFDLFRDEGYILAEHNGRFCVILKEGCAPHDMLRSLFHVNYLYWLERNVGIESRCVAGDCSPGGRLDISLDYVKREFDHVKHDGQLVGWVTDGLIARPLPNRIRLGSTAEV